MSIVDLFFVFAGMAVFVVLLAGILLWMILARTPKGWRARDESAERIKRLYRSRTDKVFAGICGGFAEFFNIDPVIVRLGFVLFTLLTGGFPGLLFYMIAIFIVPIEPTTSPSGYSR